MKEEANELTGKTKAKSPLLSTEGREIKQLEDRRKELIKKENRPEREGENRVHRAEQNCEKEVQTKITKEMNKFC